MKQPKLPDDPDIRGTPCWIMRDGRIFDAISGREAVLPDQPGTRK